MIEEMKKEILEVFHNKHYQDMENSEYFMDDIIKILDKYNNKQTLVTLKDFENVSNQLIKYKGAFENLQNDIKEQIDLLQNWCGGCEICHSIPEPKENITYSDLYNKIQELEAKYNLGDK